MIAASAKTAHLGSEVMVVTTNGVCMVKVVKYLRFNAIIAIIIVIACINYASAVPSFVHIMFNSGSSLVSKSL